MTGNMVVGPSLGFDYYLTTITPPEYVQYVRIADMLAMLFVPLFVFFKQTWQPFCFLLSLPPSSFLPVYPRRHTRHRFTDSCHCHRKPTAGRRVHELFKRRALTTIANDVVVDFGLSLLAFSASFIYMLVAMAVFMASINPDDGHSVDAVELVSSLGCLLFGWVACLLFVKTSLEVFRSGFKTVFVCFVQVGWFL